MFLFHCFYPIVGLKAPDKYSANDVAYTICYVMRLFSVSLGRISSIPISESRYVIISVYVRRPCVDRLRKQSINIRWNIITRRIAVAHNVGGQTLLLEKKRSPVFLSPNAYNFRIFFLFATIKWARGKVNLGPRQWPVRRISKWPARSYSSHNLCINYVYKYI